MLRNIYLFIFILVFSFTSCSNDEKSKTSEIKKPVVVNIPDVLKKDTIISKHLSELSQNLGDFSVIVENVADGLDAIGIKDIKNPSLFEKMQLMKIVLPKVEPAMKLVRNIQQLDIISEKIKDTLPQDKKNAFIAFERVFKNKFDTLNNRFKQYLTKDN